MNVHEFVEMRFPKLGINKRREAARLLHEIAQRESIPYDAVLPEQDFKQFQDLKRFLIQKRYPDSHARAGLRSFYLPKLDVNPKRAANLVRPLFQPQEIHIEKSVSASPLAERAKTAFPKAEISSIPSLKEFLKGKTFSIDDYNRRTDALFITNQITEFFDPCPCTKGAVHCGYNIMNLGFGCPFECTYCYLQEYQNVPGMVIPANLDDFFNCFDPSALRQGCFGKPRVGSGEFTDSLVFDPITEYSIPIIDFFRNHPDVYFEFKTKSVNIQNILRREPAPNIVVSWSLNPPEIIASQEPLTTSLPERLQAANACAEAGFKVGFHFDPVFHYTGWEEDYREVVERLFDAVSPQDIAWISLGTFRFAPRLKKVIENRFPQSTILDEELLLDFDGKMRYEKPVREEMLKKMEGWLKSRAPDVPTYPCMEPPNTWGKYEVPSTN